MIRVHTPMGTREISAPFEGRLYDLLLREGVSLVAPCGGRCLCGKCRVRVAGAAPAETQENALLSDKDKELGIRLACAVPVCDGMEVWLLEAGAANIMTEGQDVRLAGFAPCVTVEEFALAEPSLSDQRDDLSRLESALGTRVNAPLSLLAKLPAALRENGFKGRARLWRTADQPAWLVGLDAGAGTALGIAVDIGTTTVAMYLYNLETGELAGVESRLNPQTAYGADVITRTDYAASAEGLTALTGCIRLALAEMAQTLCERVSASTDDIAHVTIAGNTVMMHLLAGLPPANIAVLPFVPAMARGLTVAARELALPFSNARVSLMPSVAGYVGADAVAATLVFTGMMAEADAALMIDIGTNGELVLSANGKLYSCSTAAGPAFEGAHIRCGSGGVAGAISKFRLNDDLSSDITVIGNVAPHAICGSGLVDIIAEMLRVGVLDDMGRIDFTEASGALKQYERQIDNKPAFFVANGGGEEIVICQRDVREVQLAKGAIAAGIQVLLSESGITLADLSAIYLAGGFGNYIDVNSACSIGLLPQGLAEKVKPIGNAAGAGAGMALLNRDKLLRADELREQMQYVELSARADFQDLFVDNMMFML